MRKYRATLVKDMCQLWLFVVLFFCISVVSVEQLFANYAYVTNEFDGTVSVIQTPDNTVVATIHVGNVPFSFPFGVAITPDGAYAYVTNQLDSTISVIRTSDNTVVAIIHGFTDPSGVAITPDGVYAYVANNLFIGTISVIRTADNTIVTTISGVSDPVGVAITPDGAYVYVTTQGDSAVSVIRTLDNTVVATIPVGSSPSGVAITPDGAYAYVANQGSGTVSVIRTSDNMVVATIPVGNSPVGVAITPNLSVAFTASPNPTDVNVAVAFTSSVSGGVAPYTYSWNFGDGGTSTVANPTHAYVAPGTYRVTLTVTDPAGDSFTTPALEIRVHSSLKARISAAPNPTDVGVPVAFHAHVTGGVAPFNLKTAVGDGKVMQDFDSELVQTERHIPQVVKGPSVGNDSGSKDCVNLPSPTAVFRFKYQWYFGDGKESTEAHPKHTYRAPGEYRVTLKVRDHVGRTATHHIKVVVTHRLGISIEAHPSVGTMRTRFALSPHVRGGVAPFEYKWHFGDGKESTEAHPKHTYAAPGTYHVKLTVIDSVGDRAFSKSTTIRVVEPLAASLDMHPTIGGSETQFAFTSTVSGGEKPYKYCWDFGDGIHSIEAKSSHRYKRAGRYSVTLTVIDAIGSQITVGPAFLVVGPAL